MLSDEQLLRYNRQIMLPQFDVAGQQRLLNAKVLLVGLGGLGCPAALYLAAAGVGELRLADGDVVDISNLQRQIAHGEADRGRSKVSSAATAIKQLNGQTRMVELPRHLQYEELQQQAAQVDLIVDATDSFATRLEINRVCLAANTPWVSGAALRSEGQVAVFNPATGGPCYRCLYPEGSDEPQLSCAESGVLAPIVGVIGSLQALEAVKLLAGFGQPLNNTMLLIDGYTLQVQRIELRKNPECGCCG